MKPANILKTVAVICALMEPATAATYFVATNGNDSNNGTKESPWASLKKANKMVNAGDTVWIRGGRYMHTDTSYVSNDKMFAGVYLTKSGASDNNRIHYLAYPGEKPIFDFSKMPIANGTDGIRYTSGFMIQGSYLHLKGFEVCNVPMKGESNVGVYISRSKHVWLELIDSHHNGGSGFFDNERGTGSGGGHLFLNCDSHDNYDPNGRQGDGQNADGFGVHYQTTGDTTKFIGCRAWWNSDDGWDFISQEKPVLIENSWAMGHGYSNYGTGKPKDGNGNGFKAGSSKTGIRHTIRNCVAWKNKASGFYANHSSGGNDWINNTAYMNGTAFNMWASTWDANDNRADGVILTGSKAHVMKNNIAFPNKTAYIGGQYAAGEYNTWNLNITPTESDFLSVNDPSMTVTGKELGPLGGAFGPRKPDGSLPDIDFLKLSPKSQMIDKGVAYGLKYDGKAPDLGAYEYSAYTKPEEDKPAEINIESADSLVYEVEKGFISGGVVETLHEGFSGEGYVNLDNNSSSYVIVAIWNETAGKKDLKITYANGGKSDRPVSLSVNDVEQIKSLNLATTGEWTNWTSADFSLNLPAGKNLIKIKSITEDGAPNIDKIEFESIEKPPMGLRQKQLLGKAKNSRHYYANGRALGAKEREALERGNLKIKVF